jgi:phosphate transport system substrate-binding protein
MRHAFRWLTVAAVPVLGITLLALYGCGGAEDKRLNIGGATFIYPMMDKWASIYEKEKGVKVNYNSIGSGGGIRQMTDKTFDFGCSDAPMNAEQLENASKQGGEVVHIPLAMGGVVPAYNLPSVKKPVRFTGPILADIFMGEISNWSDKRLQDIQEQGVTLPKLDISVVHRSDGSGTTYIFVEYLSKVSPDKWGGRNGPGVGTSVKFPVGVGQKGNEGVAGHVGRNEGAIGYIELIYALSNDIKFGSVKNKAGEYVAASLESVTAAGDAALKDIPDDLRYSLTDAPGKESYPISGTNWAIVYVNPPKNGKAIVDFLRWCTHEGQQHTKDLHYAPLPKGIVERVDKKLDMIKVK